MAIYFYCYDNNEPTGGIKQIYRHVDILNNADMEAFVLHQEEGFLCTWFQNETKIAYVSKLSLTPNDILVAPELVGPTFSRTAPGINKVIFNQNCYYTFTGYFLDPTNMESPYRNDDLKAVITVSKDSADYMRFAFPHIPVHRVRNGIDNRLFRYEEKKKRLIAFMPRKNPHAVTQVINMLKFRGSLQGYELAPIDGLSEEGVAQILRESSIFLSFGFPEGFGLPPAEAMACGCVVAGFHGGGGKEFFWPEFSYPVPQEDITGYVATVERVIDLFNNEPETMKRKGIKASEFIGANYSLDKESKTVIAAFQAILQSG